jgi:hypothetical protein
MDIAIQDYEAGKELADPTAPDEMDRKLANHIAAILTRTEDMLQRDDAEVDMDEFFLARGDILDMFQNAGLIDWLREMRLQNRCPARTYAVKE